MAAKRLAVFDPSGRLIADLTPLAEQARVTLHVATAAEIPSGCVALLLAPLVATELPPLGPDGPPRWIVGDGSNAARVAGAAAQAGAVGALLTPTSAAAIAAVAHTEPVTPDFDLARARGLIALSLVDLTGAAAETLMAVADGFTAADCVVWWRDGQQMTPTAARPSPVETYRQQIAGAARIAAAASGTVITAGPEPRSVIADALRSSPTEVAGLVAIIADAARRFSAAERTDLKAIAARLTRELSWLASHRRLVAEGERLMAASLHDPLTGAMTRGAFEQTIAHEVAAAARRHEGLTLVVIDVVGLRKINLAHGHRVGDEVIAQVAARVRATVRGNDPIGRLGGDEIAVLLVGATDEQATLVVRKLIARMQEEPVRVEVTPDHAAIAGTPVTTQAPTAPETGPGSAHDPSAPGLLDTDHASVPPRAGPPAPVSPASLAASAEVRHPRPGVTAPLTPVQSAEAVAAAAAVGHTLAIPIQVRAVASEIAHGERSGEAALARCYAALRGAPAGEVLIIASDERTSEGDDESDKGSLSAGTVVGGTYRVVHELSRGAMGVVYRGEDLGLNRAVAIKVLRSDLASDRDLVSRFRAEAGILASLHHPNLVQVYALGEHAGDVYFVMELVEGQPLSEVLRATLERKEWFPTNAVAAIATEIGDALDSMHALGLIHRDVKPANILLDRERDRAVLVDVGVAVKAGDQRDAAGTPGFAAPESFLEQADAPTTDVYGLAATVYCMLTGRPPFGSGPAPQVVHRQLHDPLVPPSQLRWTLSEAVDEVLAKALLPTAKRRWASASTFATALGRALERLPQTDEQEPAQRSPDEAALKHVESLLAPTQGLEHAQIAQLTHQRLVRGTVRGAHLRVLSRILQHQLGESGLAKLVGDAPHLGTALSPTLAPLAWVDLAELVAALALARIHVPDQLVPRKVGRGVMSATFPRLFGADPASLPPETVLAALPSFWGRFHDWGEADVVVHPGSADVTLHGYPGSTEVCMVIGAELERIVELTGAGAVGAAHTACACQGAEHCEFRLSWTPP